MTPVVARLVVVEWLDSGQPERAWRWLDAADVYTLVPMRSVGWLLEQPDADVLVLCPTISQPARDGDRQAIGLLGIPARSVTRRWEIADPAAAEPAPATGEAA